MTDVMIDEKASDEVGEQTPARLDTLNEQLIGQLVAQARPEGLQLTGEDGLLGQLTKRIIEGEMDEHLGYAKHDPAGRDGANSRNGARTKTVLTDIGPVEVAIPRDRDGSFEPQIVRKRQQRLTGLDGPVISLSARGLTHGEIAAHLAEVYGAQVSKQTITTITDAGDRVDGRMAEPATGCGVSGGVRRRDQRPRSATATSLTGPSTSPWASPSMAPATCWACGPANTATARAPSTGCGCSCEMKNRGVADVCIVVCDGLKGLPEAIETVWPAAITQTCVIHLLRNSFRYASRRDWAAIARDLKLVYTAASESAALEAFVGFTNT